MIYGCNANIVLQPADLAVFQEIILYNDFWRSINNNDKDGALIINNYVRYYFHNSFDFMREYNNTPLRMYMRFLQHGEHSISWELRDLPYRWGHLYSDDTGVSLHTNAWIAFQYVNTHKQSINITKYDFSESDYIWMIQDMIIYNKIKIPHNKRILDIKTFHSLNLDAHIYLLSIGCVNCTKRKGAIINGTIIPIIIAKNTILSVPIAMVLAANIVKDATSLIGYYSRYVEHIIKKQIYYPYENIVQSIFSELNQNQNDISVMLTSLYSKMAVDLVENRDIITRIRIGKLTYPLINLIITGNIECKMKNIVINKIFMVNFHYGFKLYSFWVMNKFWNITPGGHYVVNGKCCTGSSLNWERIRFVKERKNIYKIKINKSIMANYSLSDIWKTHKGYYTLRQICSSFISKMNSLMNSIDDICKKSRDMSSDNVNKDILVNITTYFNTIGWTQFTDEYYKRA